MHGAAAHTLASWDKKPWTCVGAALRKASTSPPRSKTAAAPMPEPMHMDTTPKREDLPRLFISCSSVAVARAPTPRYVCLQICGQIFGLLTGDCVTQGLEVINATEPTIDSANMAEASVPTADFWGHMLSVDPGRQQFSLLAWQDRLAYLCIPEGDPGQSPHH